MIMILMIMLMMMIMIITLWFLINGGSFIDFQVFLTPPRSLLGPPFLNFKEWKMVWKFFPGKRDVFFHQKIVFLSPKECVF